MPYLALSLSGQLPPEITLNGQATQVLCEMIAAVDVRALGTRVGHLALDEQRSLEEALQLILDLP